MASYDQALKIQPDFYQAWNNRGNALKELGRFEEAVASCDQALKIQPDCYQAWNNRGIAAGDSLGYNPWYYEQFVGLFRVEVNNAPQYLLPSLEATNSLTPELIALIEQPLAKTIAQ